MRHRLVIALLLVASCDSPPVGTGTYALDLSGAIKKHIEGVATAGPSSAMSSSGPSYAVSLKLPMESTFADSMNQFAFIAFMTESRARPNAGQYRLAVPGETVAEPKMWAVVSNNQDWPWDVADGVLNLTRASGETTVAGKFTLRLTRVQDAKVRDGPRDTLLVSGQFSTP